MKTKIIILLSILACASFLSSCSKDDGKADNEKTETGGKSNGHEYVDLGLSAKWATCNVGANSPEEYGDYYAWGETEAKETYFEENYVYYKDGKYVSIGNDISGTAYDVARTKWGGKWRIPTLTELEELQVNCSWVWTTRNNVNGFLVVSKINNNRIFLPATGFRYDTYLQDVGSRGFYWFSTIDMPNWRYAGMFEFNSSRNYITSAPRYFGHCVRPVTE